jgi:hypothetical protein
MKAKKAKRGKGLRKGKGLKPQKTLRTFDVTNAVAVLTKQVQQLQQQVSQLTGAGRSGKD